MDINTQAQQREAVVQGRSLTVYDSFENFGICPLVPFVPAVPCPPILYKIYHSTTAPASTAIKNYKFTK
ncbi:MAG: hypothetical protein LBJ00_09470 [Planctomycetaceae bacterium]|nr:hypothetical protein [Planctomycetaceae bacterium]